MKECSKEDGGFEIDGENGFVTAMETKGFKLEELTPQQWKRVRENLQMDMTVADKPKHTNQPEYDT